MKAMILAAGLGTRLQPLTNDRPKALIEVGGRTLLEIVLTRLRKFDIREVIINVHHFPDRIVEFLKLRDNFGMHVEISHEEILLDTGGGLKRAAYFFANDDQPFLLHNVDVISAIDFRRMLDYHLESRALATLAVHDRPTSRYLLFDEKLQLCGRRSTKDAKDQIVRVTKEKKALAFSGIHIISPAIFSKISEDGVFSIIDTYLRLAGDGEKIHAFRADEYYWRDLGRVEHLLLIEDELKRKLLPEF